MISIHDPSSGWKAICEARMAAAATANADDASVWRWFAAMLEERRIRWRFMFNAWVVHVDRKEVAIEPSFYEAIRSAKCESEELGLGAL
ncbi:hypothetical protein QZM97_08720 [Burkholderia orbicola]|uniref:hypothetical protein n=1 Tax=Burkholderia TaxID=32008 RepID=UPI00075ED90A|nr:MULTISPECIES: hypothetical protein [Burkholderia]AQQ26681.1 hypothetical protein A8E88_13965 [Burkholderia cenocepacia]AXK68059.1 hypothetical protein DCN14_36140 [Burkholderia sp. IDO3]KVS24825.1 hypothetical protein WK36_33810 [Burkholderia cepacia]MCA8120650.1 hypothetical protein [Burkholderia cepacia]MDN7779630.1 hypothetical protein [Burkholderia orbicola]